jgi:uncharacterized protein YigE (DUF2233 family)
VFLRTVARSIVRLTFGVSRSKRPLPVVAWLILAIVSLACSSAAPRPTPTLVPTPTARITPMPTVEPDDTGWQPIVNGIELRRLLVELNGVSNRLWIARVDPTRVHFRVLYDRSNPRPLSEWFANNKLLLAVNAGYFTEDYHATGLIVSDGARSGQSYTGFGGMFAVQNDRAEVRWLVAKPYNPAEPLRQAVQAFPMLAHSGGKPGIDQDDGDLARRTAIGQDRKGRIVFVVSPDAFFTLKTFAAFLAASDLELDTALNLDGGPSSGILIAGRGGTVGVDSWIKIPAVIAVEAR